MPSFARFALAALLIAPLFWADVAAAQPTDKPTQGAKPTAGKGTAKRTIGKGKGGKAQKGGKPKPKPREPGSKPGKPDESVRQQVTGQYPEHSTAEPKESPELKAMRDLDRALFPAASAPKSAPWSSSLKVPEPGPEVSTSGLPGGSDDSASEAKDGAAGDGEAKPDLSWLTTLNKPDFPVRFEPSVVRYLRYYKEDARGQKYVKAWIQKSGRYRAAVTKLLREYKLPEDVFWLALIESAFDPTIHSEAGAAGLWQFMPATGRIYGLTVNRRVDERLDPERSTHAALAHLKDLYQRFGTWELAFASYNMGYGGILAAIRKFNTNDYWELRKLEAGMPYETALYVPKIFAIAIAAKNCKVFGCDGAQLDPPAPFGDTAVDKVACAPGVTLEDVAKASGQKLDEVAALNPHVIGSRLPPLQQATLKRVSWTVYVPQGKGDKTEKGLPGAGAGGTAGGKLGTHKVRWGETLPTLAASFATSTGYLESLNDLYPHESPRPGTVIFVPSGRSPKTASEVAKKLALVAVVPDQPFSFSDRRRVFYDPVLGDTVEDVADVCGVTATELRRWNHLDTQARLQEGMRLQLYIPKDETPADVVLFEDSDVSALKVESKEFYDYFMSLEGKKRVGITVRSGDTWKKVAARYGTTVRDLERINRKSRMTPLGAGDKLVVYTKATAAPVADATGSEATDAAAGDGTGSEGDVAEGAPTEGSAPTEGTASDPTVAGKDAGPSSDGDKSDGKQGDGEQGDANKSEGGENNDSGAGGN